MEVDESALSQSDNIGQFQDLRNLRTLCAGQHENYDILRQKLVLMDMTGARLNPRSKSLAVLDGSGGEQKPPPPPDPVP